MTPDQTQPCDPNCRMCSGEYCAKHFADPCDCDVVDRHGIPSDLPTQPAHEKPSDGQWSPEPWITGKVRLNNKATAIYDQHRRLVAKMISLEGPDEANAERIVACVNFCAGFKTLPDASLSQVILSHDALAAQNAALKAENEKLKGEHQKAVDELKDHVEFRQHEELAEALLAEAALSPILKRMVDAFLNWPLPRSVNPDRCVHDCDYPHRTGTNLMSAAEAEAMFRYVLEQSGVSLIEWKSRAEKAERELENVKAKVDEERRPKRRLADIQIHEQ